MKIDKHNRRIFLQGSGGVLLALPSVSSLLGDRALGAPADGPRFIAIGHNYGTYDQVFYPLNSRSAGGTELTSVNPSFKDDQKNTKIYDLSNVISLSPLFSQIPAFQQLADKIAICHGVDKICWSGHSMDAMLCGLYGGRGLLGESIDQAMVRSGKLYSSEPMFRSFHLGQNHKRSRLAWYLDGGESRPMVQHERAKSALDYIFSNLGPTPAIIQEKKARNLSIIDFVKEDYRQLMYSSKLSHEDKIRIKQHLELLRELETRTSDQTLPICANPDPARLTNTHNNRTPEYLRDLLYVAEILIKCNLTKIVTVAFESGHIHSLSHGNGGTSTPPLNVENHQTQMLKIATEVGRFIQNLDIEESGSNTYLDNSIVYWSTDMGSTVNHVGNAVPQVVAGGKGIIQTGRFYDYRGRSVSGHNRGRPGRPMNEMHIALMRAVGLVPADWEQSGNRGFGSYHYSKYDGAHYSKFDFGDKRSALPYFLA